MLVLEEHVERQHRVAAIARPLLCRRHECLADALGPGFRCDDDVGDVSAFGARVIVSFAAQVNEAKEFAVAIFGDENGCTLRCTPKRADDRQRIGLRHLRDITPWRRTKREQLWYESEDEIGVFRPRLANADARLHYRSAA